MKHNARGTRCDTPRGTLRFAGVAPKNTADSKKLRDRVNLDDANLLTVSDTAIPNQSRGITRRYPRIPLQQNTERVPR